MKHSPMMNGVKALTLSLALLLLALLLFSPSRGAELPLLSTKTPPPPGEAETLQGEVEQAIRNAIFDQAGLVPVFELYTTHIDHISISQDGEWAVAWLNPQDAETGELIAAEPGLSIVKRKGTEWYAILPGFSNWTGAVEDAPEELLSPEEKATWLEMNAQALAPAGVGPFSGYLLPWAGGDTLYMTQSVKHDKYTPSGNAHYAFDFATPGVAKMFNLYAAKSGRVHRTYDACPNNSETCANLFVLEDTTTSPTTYQLYLHLAQNSIPTALKTKGTFVAQGDFIGVADDTGTSTAHHLHFMVHTNPDSYWGTSVDITFNDVSINGGRPRISADLPYCRNDATYNDVCDQVRNDYTSGNYPQGDHTPPYGDMLAPATGDLVESTSLRLEGWATDSGVGLGSAQFLARYDEAWHAIGGSYSSLYFFYDWNMCTSGVPDGPVSVALQLRDKIGNQSEGLVGLRHFTKNFTCPPPPPACSPSADQVALFAGADYSGACTLAGVGSYANGSAFGVLGDDNAASILVGSNVMATLWFNASYQGRGESFTASDPHLTDNPIGSDSASSMRVASRSSLPLTPTLAWPPNSAVFSGTASVSLAWNNAGNATQYQAEWTLNGGAATLSPWIDRPYWSLGSLSQGTVSWRARARNANGTSAWSAPYTFSLSPPAALPSPVTAPYTETVESLPANWSTSAYWDLTALNNHTPGGSISWKYDTNVKPADGYDTGSANSSDLTSPPIALPAGQEAYLRFWYLYQTESPGVHWDQRWLQLSVNGGPFTNTLQLSDDAPNVWLRSPAIPLAQYAGGNVQVRFHFETLDKELNKYQGWFIDDVSITSDGPPTCNDANESNDSPAQAAGLTLNGALSGQICPAGDVDYFSLNASAGDRLGVRVEGSASDPTSVLDPYLYLLDADERSVLAENDDQVLAQRTDSELAYPVTRSQAYFLKVRAWDHPAVGDESYHYTLRVYNDHNDPVGAFVTPQSNQRISNPSATLQVAATDDLSGVSHVQFLWHNADWQDGVWQVIGEDWDGQDGWSLPFDSSQLDMQVGMAFFAKIYDLSGNWIGVGAWNLSNPAAQVYLPLIKR